MKKLKKNSQIVVVGKKWFDKLNGNTYHSSELIVNGDTIDKIPFTYGYGNQFEQSALDLLQKHYKGFDTVKMLWKVKDMGYKLTVIDGGYGLKKQL